MPSKDCQAGKGYLKRAVLVEALPKWCTRYNLETPLLGVLPDVIENIGS
jgi:hypothetical protein